MKKLKNNTVTPLAGSHNGRQLKELVSRLAARHGHLSAAQLAASAGLTKRNLSLALKHSYGFGITSLIRQAKMKLAWTLLRTTDKKTAHVAKDLGYASLSHFSRAFKKFYSLSPAQARQLKDKRSFCRKLQWLSFREVDRLRSEWNSKITAT